MLTYKFILRAFLIISICHFASQAQAFKFINSEASDAQIIKRIYAEDEVTKKRLDDGLKAYNQDKGTQYTINDYIDKILVKDEAARWAYAYNNTSASTMDWQHDETPPKPKNKQQLLTAVTGCDANSGLFQGLIDTGKKIFMGIRDLIYVVAGFGIMAVAIGGFFGTLNWKWLGAIVISLVVIATTGELINMITGCKEFTKQMITDTLK